MGYSPWVHKESDMTEATENTHTYIGPHYTFLKETLLFHISHQSPAKSEKFLIIFPF